MKATHSRFRFGFSLLLALVSIAAVPLVARAEPGVGFHKGGYQIGHKAADKVSFHGAVPTPQVANTVPTRTVLETKGLLASGGSGTATATSGAATLAKVQGTITSEALTTAAGAAYTLTLTNSLITASSIVLTSVDTGTNTTAGIEAGRVTPGSGSCTILVWNRHASAALNGTIKISYVVVQ